MKPRCWLVRNSRFPLWGPGDVVGSVIAPDHRTAREAAEREYGVRVVVEPAPRTKASGERSPQRDPGGAA